MRKLERAEMTDRGALGPPEEGIWSADSTAPVSFVDPLIAFVDPLIAVSMEAGSITLPGGSRGIVVGRDMIIELGEPACDPCVDK